MAIDVATLTTDQVYELGKKLRIKGRSKMSPEDLRAACALEVAEHGDPTDAEELEADLEPETQPIPAGPAGPDAPAVPEPAVTVEQIQKIRAARAESLEAVLSDLDLPGYLRAAVETELDERQQAAEAKVQAEARRTAQVRYRVTKGGRYVSKDGFVTHLSEGVLVTPLTHDLKHVAAQGILWESIEDVGVTFGQLGEQITKVQ